MASAEGRVFDLLLDVYTCRVTDAKEALVKVYCTQTIARWCVSVDVFERVYYRIRRAWQQDRSALVSFCLHLPAVPQGFKVDLSLSEVWYFNSHTLQRASLFVQDAVCRALIYNDEFGETADLWHLMTAVDPRIRQKYVGDLLCQIEDLDGYRNKYVALEGLELDEDTYHHLDLASDDESFYVVPLNVQRSCVEECLKEWVETRDPDSLLALRHCCLAEAWTEDTKKRFHSAICVHSLPTVKTDFPPELWVVLRMVPVPELEDYYRDEIAKGTPGAFGAMACLPKEVVSKYTDSFIDYMKKYVQGENRGEAFADAILVLQHLPLDHSIYALVEDCDDWKDSDFALVHLLPLPVLNQLAESCRFYFSVHTKYYLPDSVREVCWPFDDYSLGAPWALPHAVSSGSSWDCTVQSAVYESVFERGYDDIKDALKALHRLELPDSSLLKDLEPVVAACTDPSVTHMMHALLVRQTWKESQ